MPIPGNEESGAQSRQQQVQQQQSFNYSSAIPIKKRRFPTIQPSSPPPEEIPTIYEDEDSKNKQENNNPDAGLSSSDARDTPSLGSSDVSRIPTATVKKEVNPINIQSGQANLVGIVVSKPLEAKPSTSLGPLVDSGNKTDILQSEKSSEPEVPESCMDAQTVNVKQEIVSEQVEGIRQIELTTGKMNVELSLGQKEPLVPALERHSSEAISHKSNKLDSNRSNWDLNTTMDVWEGSTSCNAFAHRLVDIGGFGKTNRCDDDDVWEGSTSCNAFAHRLVDIGGFSKTNRCDDDDKSSLTTASTVGLSSNKGKNILDGHRSSFTNASTRPSQECKTDDSLGLMLATPYMDTRRECSSLSDNFVSTSTSPNLNLNLEHLSIMNVNRTVKSEPVDDNSKRDCSIGSCSSSNMDLLKFSSVKREFANMHGLETLLQSSINAEKIVGCRPIKSEVVQVCNQEACKSEDAAILHSAGRVIQHQENCAWSSGLPVPSRHQNLCPSSLQICSELTTSGDLSNQSEQSFHSDELYHNDTPDELISAMVSKPVSQDNNPLMQCKAGNLNVVDPKMHELARVDEHTSEFCQYGEVAANDEEKLNISPEIPEKDSLGSDYECQQNCAVDTICDKENEEYEDGEVRDPIQHSAGQDPIVEEKKTGKLELVESDYQDIKTLDLEDRDAMKKNQEESLSEPNKNCPMSRLECNSDGKSSQELFDKLLVVDNEKTSNVTSDKQIDVLGKDVQKNSGKEVLDDVPTNRSHGIDVGLGDEAADKVEGNCSREEYLTLSKVESSLNGQGAAKDSNNISNKSRVINLSRASVVTTPYKTKSISNRLLTSRSGKGKYSDIDGEMQPKGDSDEFYTGGSNKFVKGRFHGQPFRNSRPNFIPGKGRMPGRFGSLRSEWDSNHDFASETSYDHQVIRRKHASYISDVELECNGYGLPQDSCASSGNRRKTINDEFPSVRRTSIRRLVSGDRDGPVTRGVQMIHRIPRNMGPRRCPIDDDSGMIGLRHDDKFMRHLPDDIVDPVYTHPQAIYDELDSQLLRGNRKFSTLQRKGFPRIQSKSPVRSRTRSPSPWSSPRRRSPDGVPELSQHRSPVLYRTGRIKSPDRACFRDEMVARRRGSPSYITRPNDLRDVDSVREHVHHGSADSIRRSSSGRVFPRSARRADILDSREMGGGDEYMNGLWPSNKFHELRGDGNIDEGRKFIERRGPLRSFRPSYGSDNDNFRFHLNDGLRPYRSCPDSDAEFIERSNMREREFDGRIKHQSLVVSRRIRNMEEQQEGNYRPVERVWHDDGFADARVKRRRF